MRLVVTLTKNIRLTWIEYLLDCVTRKWNWNKIFIFEKNLHNWSLGSESETGINIPMVLDRRRESDNLCYLKLGNIILINHTTNQVLSRLKKMVRRANIIPPNINIILHFILSSSGQRVNTNIGIYLNLILYIVYLFTYLAAGSWAVEVSYYSYKIEISNEGVV